MDADYLLLMQAFAVPFLAIGNDGKLSTASAVSRNLASMYVAFVIARSLLQIAAHWLRRPVRRFSLIGELLANAVRIGRCTALNGILWIL